MSAPIIQTIPLDALRDWLLKHAKAERQNGEIAFANHTMNLRDAITRAAKKQPDQQPDVIFTAQSDMK